MKLSQHPLFLFPLVIYVNTFEQKVIFLDFVNDIETCDLFIVVRMDGVNRLDCKEL